MDIEGKYRVFISYSHQDDSKVEEIVKVLENDPSKLLVPVFDKKIPEGLDFADVIERYIAHSHVFMPILTNISLERCWVHQEIGYAKALHIPVLPICIKPISKEDSLPLPDAMIRSLNAIILENNVSDAVSKLSYSKFDMLIKKEKYEAPTYICKEYSEERTALMAEYANEAESMEGHLFLRQKGGLSSLHIPNKWITDKVWDDRYSPGRKNDYHCKLLLEERNALEAHARQEGCRLIVNTDIITKNCSKIAQRARISTFLEFLHSMHNENLDDKIDIVFDPNLLFETSTTILGDWFSAESNQHTIEHGYINTMFTRHALGISHKKDAFDREFDKLLGGKQKGTTLVPAITKLEDILSNL